METYQIFRVTGFLWGDFNTEHWLSFEQSMKIIGVAGDFRRHDAHVTSL